MIKVLRSSNKKSFGRLFSVPMFKFSSAGEMKASDNLKSNRFNGFMLPVLYPLWVASPLNIHLSPKIAQFIKTKQIEQIAVLAYAPDLQQINHDAPLVHQFYRQATLCNISFVKNNKFLLDPIKKVKMQSVAMELEQGKEAIQQKYNVPELKIPVVKLDYKIPSQVQTSLEFDQTGGIIPYQQKSELEKNNTIYKFQGQIMPDIRFPNGISNDVIFKMLMKFSALCTKQGNQFQQNLVYRSQVINLSQTAQKTLTIAEPLVLAFALRQKQIIPRLMHHIQDIFETEDVQERMLKVIDILYRQYVLASLLQQTGAAVTQDQNKRSMQMQVYYMLQVIRGAIDGNVGKKRFIEEIKQQFLNNNPPEQIIKAFEDECKKYIEEDDVYSGNTKQYIETLASIPYNVLCEQKFDIDSAKQVLDAKHYGMQEVKKYILEFIAVGQLKKSQKGKVLCLIGPPGVGKTTFAESVALALGRKFESISLGGVNDSSTLKGHRRTYMQSFAGKIIQALKKCKSSNPVILLDEIDKMGGSSYHGDPRSDLLEILDPNQNFSFVDNYVDHPVDLSNVLFICSANYLQNISRPLLDRLQKIELSSYTDEEKMEIARRHLLPKAIQDSGLNIGDFEMKEEVVKAIITNYTYGEAGVRYLDKLLKKVFQKVAVKLVQKQQKPIIITTDNLVDFLDQPNKNKPNYNNLAVGVAVGLGETEEQGGRVTLIEVAQRSYRQVDKKQGLLKTGNLGDILKQSVDISYTFAKKFLKQKFNNTYLFENELHLHAPEGHSKKNGAGQSLTIVTALVSFALKKAPKQGIAVAGEMSLQGRIMHVSELKEKLLAAKREGLFEVVLPKENKEQVSKMMPVVTDGLTIHYVQEFSEVAKLLFE